MPSLEKIIGENATNIAGIFSATLTEDVESLKQHLRGYAKQEVDVVKIIDGEKHTVKEVQYVKVTEPFMNEEGINSVMSLIEDIFSSKNMHLSHFENEDSAKFFARHASIQIITNLAGNAGKYQLRDFDSVAEAIFDFIYISSLRIVGNTSDKAFLAKVTSENVQQTVQQTQTTQTQPQTRHRIFGIPLPF